MNTDFLRFRFPCPHYEGTGERLSLVYGWYVKRGQDPCTSQLYSVQIVLDLWMIGREKKGSFALDELYPAIRAKHRLSFWMRVGYDQVPVASQDTDKFPTRPNEILEV